MHEEVVRVHAVVHGRVQMVGFRAFVLRHAGRLAGTVANRPDGSVECVVEGEKAELTEFVERLQEGPPAARVESVDISWEPASGGMIGMKVMS